MYLDLVHVDIYAQVIIPPSPSMEEDSVSVAKFSAILRTFKLGFLDLKCWLKYSCTYEPMASWVVQSTSS